MCPGYVEALASSILNALDQDQTQLKPDAGLVRGFGLLQASALNMSNMVGVGPFITIPLLIASMGGPLCILGWLLGGILAVCDGLVWSELSAAMPGSGGTYLYLREAFRNTRVGGVLPFLFIWQFILSGPLEIASGYIGIAQYAGYLWHGMGWWGSRLVCLSVGCAVVLLLFRRVAAVGRLTVVLWIGMLGTLLWIVGSGLVHFRPAAAFNFPADSLQFPRGLAAGLGSAMLIAMYDFLGYYDICYLGDEVRAPARTIPRSILLSVLVVGVLYLLMTLAIISVVPWREAMQSKFIAAEFMERLYSARAGGLVTVLILWTAFASVFALLFGYSRIPYAAAVDGRFFKVFAHLHPQGRFPDVSLLVIGGLAILASFGDLGPVISALLTSRILIQFIGQIAAVNYIRRRRRDIDLPFRMWLYPVPSLIAFAGWVYIFATSGWTYIAFGLITTAAGIAVYWGWSAQRSATAS